MTPKHTWARLAVTGGVFGVLACGCSNRPPAPAPPVDTPTAEHGLDRSVLPRPILPNLSHMTDSVRDQMSAGQAILVQKLRDPAVPALGLAAAYGEMGKLLMAANCFDSAAPYFLNAQALAPTDMRWPYYLGHVSKANGDLQASASFFEQALALKANDLTILLRLGDVYLADGQPDRAEPAFSRALATEPRSAAAVFGAGRASLSQGNYAAAVARLNEALRLDPRAVAVHYPLAMAYQGLGDQQQADAHLRQWRQGEIPIADPLMNDLGDLLESPAAYESRGVRALDRGDWAAAAALFRRGITLAPAEPSLRHRLGTALFMMGDPQGGLEQFEQVLRQSPRFSKAHYSLGVLMETSGRSQEAIERFALAVKYEPTYIDARLRLASVLGHTGHPREAYAQYDQILAIDPRVVEARYARALTLTRLRRYREARDALREGMQAYPTQPSFAFALARILAAAPDDAVRDGRQAASVIEGLPPDQRGADSGETMAMTLAELGQYGEAVAWQRRTIDAAHGAGRKDVAARMLDNLKLYEGGRPCRTPWREDEMP